jgi:hypothetical protein
MKMFLKIVFMLQNTIMIIIINIINAKSNYQIKNV